jgi:peptidoglycan-N-acetylglucosamine deacetylase
LGSDVKDYYRRHRWQGRGSRAMHLSRIGSFLALTLVVFCGAAGQTNWSVPVIINGRTVNIQDLVSVQTALKQAHSSVRDGTLYSVVTHRRLDLHGVPALIKLNGMLVGPTRRVRGGDSVQAVSGVDAVELVTDQDVPIPSGLPQVEHRLWNPGVTGIEAVSSGARSGEMVGRETLVPMVPAAPEALPMVALTFDDGPDATYTPQVVQLLNERGIKATFCIVGARARKHPELVAAIAAQGHTLCDHTEHHLAGLKSKPKALIQAEIGATHDLISQITGKPPAFFRAPGGSLNDTVIGIAQSMGMRVLSWSVDPKDFERPGPTVILSRILSQVKPGSVILLHDGGGNRSGTVAQLGQLISRLQALGYGFRTP